MRRPLFALATAVIAAAIVLPVSAFAQSPRDRGGEDQQKEDEAKKKSKDEWRQPNTRLPGQRNAGPCPFVKVLYDAGRYVEFEGGREAAAAVGFTGEIEGVSAGCSYRENDPIAVELDVGFGLGRGPTAQGDQKTYTYWVAVTHRNRAILAKEYFTLPVRFPAGQDRVVMNERLSGIVIPRADTTTSGSNFEILVGFEVTPQMAEFNRDGKRFRVNVAPVQAAAATPPTAAPQ